MFDIVKGFENRTSAVLEYCDGSLEDLINERKDGGFSEEEIT
jgi:citrate lyase alpha subunit